jgi:sulfonate transport system substrate-binding protein
MSLTRTRTGVAALALAAGLAIVRPAPAAEMDHATIALPAITFAFVPIYIASDMGFWTKRGLEVKSPVITGIGAMNAVLSGSVEFSISSMPSVIRANIRGRKIMAIGQAFEGTAVEVVMRKDLAEAAGITMASPVEKRAAALKGVKVAMLAPNTIVHAFLRYFARKGGIDPERDFPIAIMSQQASIAALRSKDVGAMAQVLPYSTIAIHNGTAAMLASGPAGDFPELLPFALNGITARPDTCEKRPSTCEKMVAGYEEAMRFLKTHPKESGAILKKRIPHMDQATFDDAFETTRKWTPDTMKIDVAGMRHAQELMLVGQMIRPDQKLASFDAIYTNKYVK